MCDLDDQARLAVYAEVTGHTPQEVSDAIWGSGLDLSSDRGDLTSAEFIAEASKRLGTPLTARLWADARKAGMPPNDEVVAIASRLTVPMAVLTNNGHILKEQIEHIFPELARLAGPHFYTSAEFKTFKPDPTIYLRCCERAGFEPSKTLFVDDRQENVEGALEAGLMAHRYTTPSLLQDALASVLTTGALQGHNRA